MKYKSKKYTYITTCIYIVGTYMYIMYFVCVYRERERERERERIGSFGKDMEMNSMLGRSN